MGVGCTAMDARRQQHEKRSMGQIAPIQSDLDHHSTPVLAAGIALYAEGYHVSGVTLIVVGALLALSLGS